MKCAFDMKKSELIEEVIRLRREISELANLTNFEICENLGISTEQDYDLMNSIRIGYMQGKLDFLNESWLRK